MKDTAAITQNTSASPEVERDAPPLTDADTAALERIHALCPDATPRHLLPDVPPSRIPRHIAVIMDGNGRWARQRGSPRIFGHRAGAAAVREALEAAGEIGLEVLTLYSFSSENWKRPTEEIHALMDLYVQYMEEERDELVRRNIRFRQIGRREGMPPAALRALDSMVDATAHCTGPTLCLAVNYGSRAEMTEAVRTLAARVRAGEIDPDDITEESIAAHLDTAGLPDPDLLIRTAGERRLSNYLLWQISYAELHVTDVCWPDFGREDLLNAIRDYASRTRRFGGLRNEARPSHDEQYALNAGQPSHAP